MRSYFINSVGLCCAYCAVCGGVGGVFVVIMLVIDFGFVVYGAWVFVWLLSLYVCLLLLFYFCLTLCDCWIWFG